MLFLNGCYYNLSRDFQEVSIFQFSKRIGVHIPCFCYHEKLTIAGNCRICTVDINNSVVVSCATPLTNNLVIHTNSKRVLQNRFNTLKILLINHPLDCPICDRGGECDLQDIVMEYGFDINNYNFNKRAVNNFDAFNPLIKTFMSRCIHCTRCVRFLNEISNSYELGVVGRGSKMEIGTFINTFLLNELSGNVIDLCPVGALTSAPYSFVSRPWELITVETLDVLDSLASSIRVDISYNKIVRVLPGLNENINEE